MKHAAGLAPLIAAHNEPGSLNQADAAQVGQETAHAQLTFMHFDFGNVARHESYEALQRFNFTHQWANLGLAVASLFIPLRGARDAVHEEMIYRKVERRFGVENLRGDTREERVVRANTRRVTRAAEYAVEQPGRRNIFIAHAATHEGMHEEVGTGSGALSKDQRDIVVAKMHQRVGEYRQARNDEDKLIVAENFHNDLLEQLIAVGVLPQLTRYQGTYSSAREFLEHFSGKKLIGIAAETAFDKAVRTMVIARNIVIGPRTQMLEERRLTGKLTERMNGVPWLREVSLIRLPSVFLVSLGTGFVSRQLRTIARVNPITVIPAIAYTVVKAGVESVAQLRRTRAAKQWQQANGQSARTESRLQVIDNDPLLYDSLRADRVIQVLEAAIHSPDPVDLDEIADIQARIELSAEGRDLIHAAPGHTYDEDLEIITALLARVTGDTQKVVYDQNYEQRVAIAKEVITRGIKEKDAEFNKNLAIASVARMAMTGGLIAGTLVLADILRYLITSHFFGGHGPEGVHVQPTPTQTPGMEPTPIPPVPTQVPAKDWNDWFAHNQYGIHNFDTGYFADNPLWDQVKDIIHENNSATGWSIDVVPGLQHIGNLDVNVLDLMHHGHLEALVTFVDGSGHTYHVLCQVDQNGNILVPQPLQNIFFNQQYQGIYGHHSVVQSVQVIIDPNYAQQMGLDPHQELIVATAFTGDQPLAPTGLTVPGTTGQVSGLFDNTLLSQSLAATDGDQSSSIQGDVYLTHFYLSFLQPDLYFYGKPSQMLVYRADSHLPYDTDGRLPIAQQKKGRRNRLMKVPSLGSPIVTRSLHTVSQSAQPGDVVAHSPQVIVPANYFAWRDQVIGGAGAVLDPQALAQIQPGTQPLVYVKADVMRTLILSMHQQMCIDANNIRGFKQLEELLESVNPSTHDANGLVSSISVFLRTHTQFTFHRKDGGTTQTWDLKEVYRLFNDEPGIQMASKVYLLRMLVLNGINTMTPPLEERLLMDPSIKPDQVAMFIDFIGKLREENQHNELYHVLARSLQL